MANVHNFSESHIVRHLIVNATQGTTQSAWVDPFVSGEADRCVFMLILGATSENVDFSLTQATNTSAGGEKAITGASITTLTSSTDEVVVTIEIGPGALDDVNEFKYVSATVTVASAGTSPFAVLQINHRLRYPGIQSQHASYSQQVIVF